MTSPNDQQNRSQAAWYETWFDSPYYPILYQHRDTDEAQVFIDYLLALLRPSPGARVLDLACGRGRHSRYLAQKGLQVTGLDLSERSITFAKQFETDHLSFYKHDMRLPFRINYFDFVFNFFTSFGYFKYEREELRVLKNVAAGLRPGGVFVLDFFNSHYVRAHLTGWQEKEIQGILFKTQKAIEGNFVTKEIWFNDQGKDYYFKEEVRLLEQEDFEQLFALAGFEILGFYGDYHLQRYDNEKSLRLISIVKKR